MKIGWYTGNYNWTYKNLAKSVSKYMPDDEHLFDEMGDVTMVMSLDQLGKKKKRNANRSNRKRSSPH